MTAAPRERYLTREEYLRHEREAEYKSEYHDGVIVAMAGASPRHTRIVGNLFFAFRNQLERGRCETWNTDIRVWVPACNKYYYPDLAVVCGGSHFEMVEQMESLLNPTLIVEVLSPSTENYDRGEKFDCYSSMDSLSMYVMVMQDKPKVQIYSRLEDGDWRLHPVEGLESTLELHDLGCAIPLVDIYEDVVFAEARKPHDDV